MILLLYVVQTTLLLLMDRIYPTETASVNVRNLTEDAFSNKSFVVPHAFTLRIGKLSNEEFKFRLILPPNADYIILFIKSRNACSREMQCKPLRAGFEQMNWGEYIALGNHLRYNFNCEHNVDFIVLRRNRKNDDFWILYPSQRNRTCRQHSYSVDITGIVAYKSLRNELQQTCCFHSTDQLICFDHYKQSQTVELVQKFANECTYDSKSLAHLLSEELYEEEIDPLAKSFAFALKRFDKELNSKIYEKINKSNFPSLNSFVLNILRSNLAVDAYKDLLKYMYKQIQSGLNSNEMLNDFLNNMEKYFGKMCDSLKTDIGPFLTETDAHVANHFKENLIETMDMQEIDSVFQYTLDGFARILDLIFSNESQVKAKTFINSNSINTEMELKFEMYICVAKRYVTQVIKEGSDHQQDAKLDEIINYFEIIIDDLFNQLKRLFIL